MAEENPGTVDTNNPGNNPSWMDQLPEDLKGNDSLTSFKTIGDLGKSYLDLSRNSENSLQLIGNDADDETRNAFYNRLGRPEKAEKYTFNRPQMPEGTNYNEQMESDYKENAHKLGLTQAQAEGDYKYFMAKILEANSSINQNAENERTEAITFLQNSWGDNFNANCEIATRAFMAFADDDQKQFFVDSKLGDNPKIIKLFHEIGTKLLDHKIITGMPANQNNENERPKGIDGKPILSYQGMEDNG